MSFGFLIKIIILAKRTDTIIIPTKRPQACKKLVITPRPLAVLRRLPARLAGLSTSRRLPSICPTKIFPNRRATSIAGIVINRISSINCPTILAFVIPIDSSIPAVIVPKAYTAENHQEYNAKSLEKAGGAVCITERELNEDSLYDTVLGLLNDKDKLEEMAKASRAFGKRDAIDQIYGRISAFF